MMLIKAMRERRFMYREQKSQNTESNHFADVGNMMFMKSQFVTSPNVICFKRAEFDTFNQWVGLFAKNWRSQFATSKFQYSRSQFATLKTGADYHFLGVNKMASVFGGGDG